MFTPTIQRAGLIGTAALCISLLGCKLDQAELVEGIEDMIHEQLSLDVAKVECPTDIAIESGKVFECQVTFQIGGEVPITVTITDSVGSLLMETKYKVLDPNEMRSNGVDCGDAVIALAPGTTLDCTSEGEKLIGTVNEEEEVEFEPS